MATCRSSLFRINGATLRMDFDTGAVVTSVTPEAALRARLPVDPHIASFVGIGGPTARHFATFAAASAGDVHFPPVIGAIAEFGAATGANPIDGLLGADILAHYDIDLDEAGRLATFYRGRLCSPDEIPWPTAPRTIDAYGHSADYDARLFLPVSVNGTSLIAVFDSGAAWTVLSEGDAARIGGERQRLVASQPVSLRGIGPRSAPGRFERFARLQVGDGTFHRRLLMISDARMREVLLGQDYIARRRVWLSFSSGRIFVDRTGPP